LFPLLVARINDPFSIHYKFVGMLAPCKIGRKDPFITLADWKDSNTLEFHFLSMGLCAAGFVFYLVLIGLGRREPPVHEAAN